MSTDDQSIERISATVSGFGLAPHEYEDALRRLLALDLAIKVRDASRYLDAILEILFRLQDTFATPFMSPDISRRVRDDVRRLTIACDGDRAVASAANDILENLLDA